MIYFIAAPCAFCIGFNGGMEAILVLHIGFNLAVFIGISGLITEAKVFVDQIMKGGTSEHNHDQGNDNKGILAIIIAMSVTISIYQIVKLLSIPSFIPLQIIFFAGPLIYNYISDIMSSNKAKEFLEENNSSSLIYIRFIYCLISLSIPVVFYYSSSLIAIFAASKAILIAFYACNLFIFYTIVERITDHSIDKTIIKLGDIPYSEVKGTDKDLLNPKEGAMGKTEQHSKALNHKTDDEKTLPEVGSPLL